MISDVILDSVLEHIMAEGAAAVVHYDIPKKQNAFAKRLLTMKACFSNDHFQNRVLTVILLCAGLPRVFGSLSLFPTFRGLESDKKEQCP